MRVQRNSQKPAGRRGLAGLRVVENILPLPRQPETAVGEVLSCVQVAAQAGFHVADRRVALRGPSGSQQTIAVCVTDQKHNRAVAKAVMR